MHASLQLTCGTAHAYSEPASLLQIPAVYHQPANMGDGWSHLALPFPPFVTNLLLTSSQALPLACAAAHASPALVSLVGFLVLVVLSCCCARGCGRYPATALPPLCNELPSLLMYAMGAGWRQEPRMCALASYSGKRMANRAWQLKNQRTHQQPSKMNA